MGLCAIAITFIFMTHNGVVPNAFRSDLSADVFNRTLGVRIHERSLDVQFGRLRGLTKRDAVPKSVRHQHGVPDGQT
jgi:hypothetical protein